MDAYTVRDTEVELKKKQSGGGVRKLGNCIPEGTAEVAVEVEVDDIAGLQVDEIRNSTYADTIDLRNGDQNSQAEAIQLRNSDGDVYNGQDFAEPAIEDPTNSYNELVSEYRNNSTNRDKVTQEQMPKIEKRLIFGFPGERNRELGIYRHGGGRVYYFKWDTYMTGIRLSQDEFEKIVKFCKLIDNQPNKDLYTEYLSPGLARKFGLVTPQPKYDAVLPTVDLSISNDEYSGVITDEVTGGFALPTRATQSTSGGF